MGAETCLPAAPDLPPTLRSFLNREFRTPEDLANASDIIDRLSCDLYECQDRLNELHSSTIAALAAWSSNSQSLSSTLSSVSHKLKEFTDNATPSDNVVRDQDVVGQLPVLAAEVARVERVRQYAETALKLEALVGDLEDAVASIVIGTPRIQLPRKMANSPSPDVLLDLSRKFSTATSSLAKIEDVIAHIMVSRPQWKKLLMSVDIRVDNAVASLRPSAIADYRLRLGAIGWPPPLSPGSVQGENHNDQMLTNPLLGLSGEMKKHFEDSFVSLCTLQALQCRRKARQSALSKNNRIIHLGNTQTNHELLWAIEEMVAPIGSKAAQHFLKWSEQPDLIFGLAYHLALKHAKVIDLVLQPMLDRVKIPGYSVREEWVSAIVSMVSNHLSTHNLPELALKLSEDLNHRPSSALWLHMVDLALAFDKKMRSIAVQSIDSLANKVEMDLFDGGDADLHLIEKYVSVFAERKEWLELWAHLELADAGEKLEREICGETAWLFNISSEVADKNNLHPQAAEVTMLRMWELVTRCRSLPQPKWQLDFITIVGAPFINKFVQNMLQHCQEAEALTALAEDGAILKVASCINAANYCECKLQEWSDDVFFLDLRRLQLSLIEEKKSYGQLLEPETMLSAVEGCVFDEEISFLGQFRTEWLQKLVSATHRSFDATSQEYQRNKKRWQESTAINNLSVSPSLIDALAMLQSRLRVLKDYLGYIMFLSFWHSLASGLDQFFMNTVVLSGARFSVYGGIQLAKDMEALFQVFKYVCLKPASFFPSFSDAVTLLTLPQEDAFELQKVLSTGSSWRGSEQTDLAVTTLREFGVRTISPLTAAKIVSQRMFH